MWHSNSSSIIAAAMPSGASLGHPEGGTENFRGDAAAPKFVNHGESKPELSDSYHTMLTVQSTRLHGPMNPMGNSVRGYAIAGRKLIFHVNLAASFQGPSPQLAIYGTVLTGRFGKE